MAPSSEKKLGDLFVRNPSTMSCVDTNFLGLEHTMAAILGSIRRGYVLDKVKAYCHLSVEEAAVVSASPEAQALIAENEAAVAEAAADLAALPTNATPTTTTPGPHTATLVGAVVDGVLTGNLANTAVGVLACPLVGGALVDGPPGVVTGLTVGMVGVPLDWQRAD